MLSFVRDHFKAPFMQERLQNCTNTPELQGLADLLPICSA